MAKHRDFAHLDIFYASFTDAIQEFIGSAVIGLRLSCPTTASVRATATSNSGQVAIGIDGRWRYRTTNYDVAVTGGAGTKTIWAVAVTENDFVGAGSDPDETDYNFELRVTDGTNPASVIAFRKIGEVDWDGTKITGLRQTVGAVDVTLPLYPTAPTVDSPALVVKGITSQAADIFKVQNSAGTTLFAVQADGDLTLAGGIELPVGETITLGGDVVVDREAANVLRVADRVHITGAVSGLGLEVDSGLQVDGNISLNGVAGPVAQSVGWSVTNKTTDKVLDADNVTLHELADVVGTLIEYLKLRGDLGS